ncbi:MAG: hypothetical protein H0X37_14975 [Herpetosiphonaceae bacterium]|nr:hypothetical protein [Herpetosiphonaceae bacterium]
MPRLPSGRWGRPLILAVALLALVLLFRSTRAPIPHIAPGAALEPPSAAVPLAGQFEAQVPLPSALPLTALPPSVEPLAATTAHLRIATRAGSYAPAQAATLAEPLEAALQYVQSRTAMQLAAPVTVIFARHAASCGLDGAAYTDQRTIYLFTCPTTPTRRAVNILAHEFVHQLAQDHYGTAHLQADLMLSEGLATWGAGSYWLGNEPDFQHFVAHNYRRGLLPLRSDYTSSDLPDAMNRLYYEWAAFVEWTLATQGRDAFDRLYRGGSARVLGSAPYSTVFGSDFPQIETRWQSWLDQ